MQPPRLIRDAVKASLAELLKNGDVRRNIAFRLKNEYYSDLQLTVPLGHNLTCPMPSADSWWSFSEIFVQQEYRTTFDHVPLPDRWLDLGCHAGFFSLYLLWLRKSKHMNINCGALLVDADSRVEAAIDSLVRLNGLEAQLKFRRGLICSTTGEQPFEERSHMYSSIPFSGSSNSSVTTITAGDISRLLPPPYDMVKLDIEGAEFDFLSSYSSLLEHTKCLLMEWHSWHRGKGGLPQLQGLLKAAGFSLIREITPPHSVTVGDISGECGVLLCTRTEA
jgi:FkbM family methyltransferase